MAPRSPHPTHATGSDRRLPAARRLARTVLAVIVGASALALDGGVVGAEATGTTAAIGVLRSVDNPEDTVRVSQSATVQVDLGAGEDIIVRLTGVTVPPGVVVDDASSISCTATTAYRSAPAAPAVQELSCDSPDGGGSILLAVLGASEGDGSIEVLDATRTIRVIGSSTTQLSTSAEWVLGNGGVQELEVKLSGLGSTSTFGLSATVGFVGTPPPPPPGCAPDALTYAVLSIYTCDFAASLKFSLSDDSFAAIRGALSTVVTGLVDTDPDDDGVSLGAADQSGTDPLPAPTNPSATVAEDGSVLIPLASLVAGGDVSTLTFDASVGRHGTTAIVGDDVRYTPATDYFGPDLFFYTVGDCPKPNDGCPPERLAAGSVGVTVTPVVDPPTTVDVNGILSEDDALDLTLGLFLSTISVDPVVALDVSSVLRQVSTEHGSVEVVGDRLVYRPDPDFNGEDVLVVQPRDTAGHQAVRPLFVDLLVRPENDAPTAVSTDPVVTDEDTGVEIDLTALVRDVEDRSSDLEYAVVTQPAPAVGTLTATDRPGTYRFEPAADTNGPVELAFSATDRGDRPGCRFGLEYCSKAVTATIPITVDVAPVDDPPRVTVTGPAAAPANSRQTYVVSVTDADPGDTSTLSSASCGTLGSLAPGSLVTTATGGTFSCDLGRGPGELRASVTATDGSGLEGVGTTTTDITWEVTDFQAPLRGDDVAIVKAGSTVPLKFEVFAGDEELTEVAALRSLTATRTSCPAGSGAHATSTATSLVGALGYDARKGHFLASWKTPKQRGACYVLALEAADGSTVTALLKTR